MDRIPWRARFAATIVPEKPAPIMQTGARRSGIAGSLRIQALDVIVNPDDRLRSGIAKHARHDGMNQGRKARAYQLEANLHRTRSVTGPGHSERAGMFQEQAID